MTTETNKTKGRYIEAVGRRKTAVARVRLTEASKNQFVVNERELNVYFPTGEMQEVVTESFSTSKVPAKFKVSAKITGGGIHAQAEAMRHGISRALVLFDEELRKKLKKAGFLKRDPRVKERRKFGLKKARKAPQWSKR
ncbi:MAG: 30S ribosomal protein S9 [Patescibacteria group bacterium]|nr:30S ribosomal protein S9 [Patescibacteria group bacterium]